MKKIINVFFIVGIFTMMFIPFLCMDRRTEVVSEIDNRRLAEAPVFGKEGFTSDYEQFMEDRIGFRDKMVNGYAIFNSIVANELTHPSYTYGQNGYIFFVMHNNIKYGDFHKTFAEAVLKIQEYCENRGSKFYFIFDPEKISVYRRYLPKGVIYDDSWVDELFSYMDDLGVNYVNTTELLTEKSYTEQVFNVQYDAGHWNDLGCFYATNALLARIHEDFPQVRELDKNQFEISVKTETNLPVSDFPIYETTPSFKLKEKYKNVTRKYSDEILRDPQYRYFHYLINQADNADTLPKVLFFQGSYYNRGPQFLVSQCSEYIGVHNYQNVLNLEYYYNIFQPDVVILDAAEYVLKDTYFNLEKMEEFDLNPGEIDFEKPFSDEAARLKKELASIEGISVHADLLSGNVIDRVIIDRQFSDTRYAYLLLDEQIYDLYRNEYGALEAALQHDAIEDTTEGTLIIEEYGGDKYCAAVPIRKAQVISDELVRSEGVSVDNEGRICFETELKNNQFSNIVLQLYNAKTGEFLGNIDNSKEGNVNGIYTHLHDTGLYKVVLKGNTNLKDESVSAVVHLIQGTDYYYSFKVNSIERKKAIAENYLLFGYTGEEEQLISSDLTESSGASVNRNGSINFKTELEGNRFSAVVLQIYDAETGEYLENIVSATEGKVDGIYTHHFNTGSYRVVLKGNTNLQDEAVSTIVDLEEGVDYCYSFVVDLIEDTKVLVKGYKVCMYK